MCTHKLMKRFIMDYPNAAKKIQNIFIPLLIKKSVERSARQTRKKYCRIL